MLIYLDSFPGMGATRCLWTVGAHIPGNASLAAFQLGMLIQSQTSFHYNMTLSIIGKEVGPVTTIPPPHHMAEGGPLMDVSFMAGSSITATHSYKNAPPLDILFVPGGTGNVVLAQQNDTWVEDFIACRYSQLDYLLSVCTGSGSLARSGVLNGKRATTNKGAWPRVVGLGTNITWVPSARWTTDGNVWTSSGVAAGEFSCLLCCLKRYMKRIFQANI